MTENGFQSIYARDNVQGSFGNSFNLQVQIYERIKSDFNINIFTLNLTFIFFFDILSWFVFKSIKMRFRKKGNFKPKF